jgi:hypothetical protein
MNNAMIHHWALAMADRIVGECGPDRDAQIGRACALALGRPPDAAEFDVTVKSFEELREKWRAELQKADLRSSPSEKTALPPAESRSAEEQAMYSALTNLCHALMNSAEFIYVD